MLYFWTLQGIGNTSQGAANCIMFVLCTQPIRTRLCTAVCCCNKCREEMQYSHDAPPSLLPGQDTSAHTEEDNTSRVRTDRWYLTLEVTASHLASLKDVPAARFGSSAGASTCACVTGKRQHACTDEVDASWLYKYVAHKYCSLMDGCYNKLPNAVLVLFTCVLVAFWALVPSVKEHQQLYLSCTVWIHLRKGYLHSEVSLWDEYSVFTLFPEYSSIVKLVKCVWRY